MKGKKAQSFKLMAWKHVSERKRRWRKKKRKNGAGEERPRAVLNAGGLKRWRDPQVAWTRGPPSVYKCELYDCQCPASVVILSGGRISSAHQAQWLSLERGGQEMAPPANCTVLAPPPPASLARSLDDLRPQKPSENWSAHPIHSIKSPPTN